MESRLEDLEIRLAHHELAIDNLTQTLLMQEQAMAQLQAELSHVKSMLRELSPSAVASAADETPPPHY
jgi:SlyX protein